MKSKAKSRDPDEEADSEGGNGCSDTVDCCVNDVTGSCIDTEGGGDCSNAVDGCASDVTGCCIDESDSRLLMEERWAAAMRWYFYYYYYKPVDYITIYKTSTLLTNAILMINTESKQRIQP